MPEVSPEIRDWFGRAIWIYQKDDERAIAKLKQKLAGKGYPDAQVWQNAEHLAPGKYVQYCCSVDLRHMGGDTAHLWRDGQSWWPASGDYSSDEEELLELAWREVLLGLATLTRPEISGV